MFIKYIFLFSLIETSFGLYNFLLIKNGSKIMKYLVTRNDNIIAVTVDKLTNQLTF